MVRAVDVYTAPAVGGLYMARPTPGRAQFHYLESWLLPSLGLRANVFHFNPGHERGRTSPRRRRGHSRPGGLADWDHYLDLVVRTGERTDLVDIDELLGRTATAW